MQMQLVRSDDTREVSGAAAIFAVADDWGAERGAMRAQLMGAPGDRHQREPARAVAGVIHHPVIGDRALAVLIIGLNPLTPPGAAGPGSLGERQIDAPLRDFGQADNRRPVGLAGCLFAKSAGE